MLHVCAETVGPIRSSKVHFNALGQPKGTAEIIFQNVGDAKKAVSEFHDREVNGRPLRVELVKGAATFEGETPAQSSSNAPYGGGGHVKGRGVARGGRREIRMV